MQKRMNKRGRNKFVRDKKAFEMMIGTAVTIVLGILVAITLIIFWDFQTGTFSNFLNNLFGKADVDSVVTVCNSIAFQDSAYNYCCLKKKVKYEKDGGIIQEELTCKELTEKNFTGGRINKLNCENAGC